MIRPTSALQPLHLSTFISSVGVVTARRKRLEATEAANLPQQKFAELRARGFQARRDREAREQAERRAQWVAQQEADQKEKQFRRKHAGMWNTPKLVPLALPPSLIRGDFLDTFNHLWLGKDGDTADLQQKLILASSPDAVFKELSPSIRAQLRAPHTITHGAIRVRVRPCARSRCFKTRNSHRCTNQLHAFRMAREVQISGRAITLQIPQKE